MQEMSVFGIDDNSSAADGDNLVHQSVSKAHNGYGENGQFSSLVIANMLYIN
jgi:hypothetical protein